MAQAEHVVALTGTPALHCFIIEGGDVAVAEEVDLSLCAPAQRLQFLLTKPVQGQIGGEKWNLPFSPFNGMDRGRLHVPLHGPLPAHLSAYQRLVFPHE